MRSLALAVLVLFALAAPASAASSPKAHVVPALEAGKPSPLTLRIVAYQGSTNGGMLVEVANPTGAPETFEAAGLYFVPGGDPEKAPQRLGATGPFDVVGAATPEVREKVVVAPGQKVRLELQVFCIDSHRPSPDAKTPFKLAGDRLPKELRTEIEAGTKQILATEKAPSAKAAKGSVQSHVWQTRDKKWVALEGERKAEKAAPSNRQHEQRELPVEQRMTY